MTSERDDLSKFRDAFLDYLERERDEPPALEDLPEEQRRAAEAFIKSIMAARGVDPYASRPSIERLLASRSQTSDRTSELGEVLQNHLRLTVDHGALITPDVASAAVGLASALVIQARGMRIRVVPESDSTDLDYALTRRAEDIARVFSAFPDSHAVLYTTIGQGPRAVIVDRGDVQGAIETPSGEMRAPRLRRSITDAATACEVWLMGMIPEFQPLSTDLLEPTAAPEVGPRSLPVGKQGSRLTCPQLVSRARVEAKRGLLGETSEIRRRNVWLPLFMRLNLDQLSEEDYRLPLR